MTDQNYARPELLASTEWLADHLDDPDVRIVDCDEFELYLRAHIRNAVGIRVHHYIKHPDYPSAPREYPLVAEPGVMKALMEDMGIGDDTLVVAYDNSGGLYSTRFWWVLNYYGHTNVKVLNGGWKKWVDEGRPISIDRPPDAGDVTFTPATDDSLVCTLDYGVAQVGNPDTVFLDVRSDGEWDGSTDRGNARAGRIPGAVHLEWLNLITEDRHRMFKSSEELRSLLEPLGVTPDKNVITY